MGIEGSAADLGGTLEDGGEGCVVPAFKSGRWRDDGLLPEREITREETCTLFFLDLEV